MTRGMTLLFAVAAGAAVGNLYWAQPLLDFIARDLHSSTSTAGWLVTATQLGYAVGILLLVPLGDRVDRHRFIPIMLIISAVALAACAAAPSMTVLLLAITGVGLTTVAGQVLTPLAGDLAPDAERGRIVGTVVSGILTGILVSRTLSGLVAGIAGWRAIYVLAAAAAVLFAVILFVKIPHLAPKTTVSYPKLISSVFGAVRRERVVRWSLVFGATGFATFTMFWTALTFLLSAPPFSFPVPVIGLFGLAGLAGALAAQRVGGLQDRGLSIPATGIAWALVLISFVVAALGARSVVVLIIAIVLLDVSIQGQSILTQTRIFAVSGAERSRLNTAFVTGNFLGGAVGSGLATVLWAWDGWIAVCGAGAALSVFALVVWLFGRRGPLKVPATGQ